MPRVRSAPRRPKKIPADPDIGGTEKRELPSRGRYSTGGMTRRMRRLRPLRLLPLMSLSAVLLPLAAAAQDAPAATPAPAAAEAAPPAPVPAPEKKKSGPTPGLSLAPSNPQVGGRLTSPAEPRACRRRGAERGVEVRGDRLLPRADAHVVGPADDAGSERR